MKVLSNTTSKKFLNGDVKKKFWKKENLLSLVPSAKIFSKSMTEKSSQRSITVGSKPNLHMKTAKVNSSTNGDSFSKIKDKRSSLKSPVLHSTERKPSTSVSAYSSLMSIIEQMKQVLQIGVDFPTTFLNQDVIYTTPVHEEDHQKDMRLNQFASKISDLEKLFINLKSHRKSGAGNGNPNEKDIDLSGIDFNMKNAFDRRLWAYEKLINSIHETLEQILLISLKLKPVTSDKLHQRSNKHSTVKCNQKVCLYRAPSHDGTVAANILKTYSSTSATDKPKGDSNASKTMKKFSAFGKLPGKSHSTFNDKTCSMSNISEELRSGIIFPTSNVRHTEIFALQKLQKCNRDTTISEQEEIIEEEPENEEEEEWEYDALEVTGNPSQSETSFSNLDETKNYDPCFIKARTYLHNVVQKKCCVK